MLNFFGKKYPKIVSQMLMFIGTNIDVEYNLHELHFPMVSFNSQCLKDLLGLGRILWYWQFYIVNIQWTICGIEMAGHHKHSQLCWYHFLKKESSLHLEAEKRLEKVKNWDVLNHLGIFDEKKFENDQKVTVKKVGWNFIWHKLCCIII